MAAGKYVYVYTKRFETYSRGKRKAGQEIVETSLFKFTPERLKMFLIKGFIRKKCVKDKGANE